MASESSFDVVSKVDMQEVKNALDQASREVEARFDFKGSEGTMTLDEKKATIELFTENEVRLRSMTDILESKLVKRGVDIRSLEFGDVEEVAKGNVRQTVSLKQGIAGDAAKQVVKAIKDSGLKVTTQQQGDQVRVVAKSKNDLQEVITLLKKSEIEVPLQFINYR